MWSVLSIEYVLVRIFINKNFINLINKIYSYPIIGFNSVFLWPVTTTLAIHRRKNKILNGLIRLILSSK